MSHIERLLNIQASTSQHNKYFRKIIKIIDSIFKKKNIPKYIMDIGCGDGSLLKNIYSYLEKILNKKKLKKISLIAVDLNSTSLNVAKKNLKNIKTVFVNESIDNPDKIFDFLKKKN